MTKIAQAVSTEFRVSTAKVKNFNHHLGDHVFSYWGSLESVARLIFDIKFCITRAHVYYRLVSCEYTNTHKNVAAAAGATAQSTSEILRTTLFKNNERVPQ